MGWPMTYERDVRHFTEAVWQKAHSSDRETASPYFRTPRMLG